jgi:nucleotide-binding universal stress UspA family protein
MFEKILVPLDGSELAEIVLPYAEELAGKLGSEIVLVYVSESAHDPDESKHMNYLQKIVQITRDGAGTYADNRGSAPAVQVKSVILTGYPAEEIVNYADREGIGLIVMATHGQSGIKLWALGSVAEKVVRATERPVVLIRARGARPDVKEKGILNKVLVALDGSAEGEAIVPYIEELALKLKAEVVLFHVLAKGYQNSYNYVPLTDKQIESDKALATDYLNKVEARLKEKGIAVEKRLSIGIIFGNAAELIIQFDKEVQADLLAMTTHGRSGVERWSFGSVAEKVLQAGTTPLLLVRSPGTRAER